MAANVYMKSFALGSGQYVKLADESIVMNTTIVASSKNSGNVNVRFRGGTPVSWPPGAAAMFEGVDISEFEVQGNGAHLLLVVGYTR